MVNGNLQSNFSNPPIQLYGEMHSGSRFGQSMGVLGDITGDGIPGTPNVNFMTTIALALKQFPVN